MRVLHDHRRHDPAVYLRLDGIFLYLFGFAAEKVGQGLPLCRPPAGDFGDLVGVVGADLRLARAVQLYLDVLAQEVDERNIAVAVLGLDERAVFRHMLQQILIRLLLIPQAAHQPPACAGDLYRVERHRLCFRHLGADGLEVVQKLVAAERPPADAETAEHFRLVAHADLPQLDARAEHAREVFYQLAEVHAPVGGEEEEDLVPLKRALDVHELHFELVLFDELPADAERFLFALAVELRNAQIVRRGAAHNGTQRLHAFAVLNHVVALDAIAELHALGRLHDERIARLRGHAGGIEIVRLAAAAEFYADYFCHGIFLIS